MGAELQPVLQAHPAPPVRVVGEFRAVSCHRADSRACMCLTLARTSPAVVVCA